MIYLIQSSAYIDNYSDKTENILKIGYCKDTGKKARMKTYKTENPTRRKLYSIPGGTEQDERNLHYHFRDFKKPYGNEWFSEAPEILEFFKSHTTKESLKTLKTKLDIRMKDKLKDENPEIEIWVRSIMEVVYKDLDLIKKQEISDDLLNDSLVNYENLQDYIQSRFPDSYKEIEKVYNELTKPLSPKIQECLDKFNSISTFPDKLRYLQTLDTDSLEPLLLQIPHKFGDYYRVFGFDKMKTLEYQESLIRKEWDKIIGNSQVKDELQERIYQEFQIGQSYTKSFIKEKLGKIYQELGYQETPKANKIEEYFEFKLCLISNKETGKRDSAYQLINKKL